MRTVPRASAARGVRGSAHAGSRRRHEAEELVAAALFEPAARPDPATTIRASGLQVPGCRHAVVDAMLRDARLDPPSIVGPPGEALFDMLHHFLIYLAGERHKQLRRRFVALFTPRQTERLRPAIERRVEELLDAVQDRGRMDLVAEFARPLPFSVIVEILGVPEERRSWLAEQFDVLAQTFAGQQDSAVLARGNVAVTEMLAYFEALLDEREADPREDLVSALAAGRPDDAESRADIVANCVFFVLAGHATTASLISGGTLLLLRNPDELERLRRDPSLMAGAVEEMLRLVTPVAQVFCRPREHVEIHGHALEPGVTRRAFLAAVNRDPDVFGDPDRFDITRTPNRHLAFSAGPHFCLGAPLARLHGEIAFSALLRRLPGLRLAGEPLWRGATPLHELEQLAVAWD